MYAFSNCKALTDLTFEGVIIGLGESVFNGVTTSNLTLTLAKGQKDFNGSTLTDTDVEAGDGKSFCGYIFKEIKFAEE